jgi:phosphoribosyl-dephospho-CoA transferase
MMRSLHSPWRHRRVWLRRDIDADQIEAAGDARAASAFVSRARLGLALVGTAAHATDPPEWRPLGLAMARGVGERIRLACCVPRSAVESVQPPLPLEHALPLLPSDISRFGERLLLHANAIGLALCVYGSAFWQHAGGSGYWHQASDLDLLARPTSAAQTDEWLDILRALDCVAPLRLDGEIELPTGEAVAWRELAGSSLKVLLKSDFGPRIRTRADISAIWKSTC